MSRQMVNKRWGLVWVLMLSVGLNFGLLVSWMVAKSKSEHTGPAVEQTEGDPGHGSEGVAGTLQRSDLGIAPRRLERIVGRMADELGLEGERREVFLGVQGEFFHRSVAGRDRLKAARAGLRRELTASSPDRARAEHWAGELGKAQSELEEAFVANYFSTRELLDPEQDRRFRRFMGRIHKMRRQLMEQGETPREPFRPRRPRRGRPRG